MSDFPDDLSDIDLVSDDDSLLDAPERSMRADDAMVEDDVPVLETDSDDESQSLDEPVDDEDEMIPVEPIPWLSEPDIEFAIDMISDKNNVPSVRLRMRVLVRILTMPDLLDPRDKESFYDMIETNVEGFSIDDIQMDAAFPIVFLFAPIDRIMEAIEFVASIRRDYMFICVTNWLKGLMLRIPDMSGELVARLVDRL
jgi:hypothetical protein